MRARLPFVLLAAALAAPVADARAFDAGVAAGEIGSTSAIFWTRAPRAGALALELSTHPRFARRIARVPTRAVAGRDRTVRLEVTGLRAATRYAYRFRQGRSVSPAGSFETAPSPRSTAPVEFAFSGDADATRRPGSRQPAFNRFQVYARMAAERNDFNINLGDTIYSDSEVGGVPPALTRRAKWAKYRQNLALPALRLLRRSTGLYSHWDDHEFVNDFTRDEHGEAVYAAGADAFLDYSPARYRQQTGLYRSVRWGRNVELFFLDERSFRDAKASAEGTCNNPQTRAPDLAPTGPLALRAAFAALVPSLAAPVAAECLAEIRDPNRTMLGTAQYARFTAAVRRSTATFKVIVNEVPIQQFYALPYDRWEGYEAERTRLLEFLRANVENVVFLTTDTHANFVGEVRLQTFEEGGPVGTGFLEVITGPVATNTYAREIDRVVGRPGSAQLLNALFFKPAPPRGIGMRCAATNVYSYAQVRVTRTTLTIVPKDLNGRLVRETGGAACGPIVVRAR